MSEKYKNLKVKDLQELLTKNELPSTGKKEELIERLVKHDEQVERELGSLEEEFGDLDEYKGETNAIELTSTTTEAALVDSEPIIESLEEKKEGAIAESTKAKSDFKFTPITFDKTPSTIKPASPIVTKAAASPALSEKSTGSTTSPQKTQSDAEKALERAKRFGVQVTDNAKKDLRAQRFGIPKKVTDEEALKKRSERFGIAKSENNSAEALKKRAERFGTNKGENDSEALQKRAARFGLDGSKVPVKLDAAEEEKKRKRAERFNDNKKKQRTE